jgi:queuine tRNA-ribosyltransferase
MEIQHLLGSDITMAFDECTPFPATESQAADSMRLSMRWAERSRKAFKPREGFALFGIVQGGMHRHLREESAKALTGIGFDGYAIGGLAVGEGQETMFQVLDYAPQLLPEDKPRYLMGVGKPSDIIGAVMRGVDMFDCVIPTRAGRFGRGYTSQGEVNIKNARYTEDAGSLDAKCDCPCCSRYSRAYLHHLFKADEMLGPLLLTMHNLYFYQNLMSSIRAAVEAGDVEKLSTGAFLEEIKET